MGYERVPRSVVNREARNPSSETKNQGAASEPSSPGREKDHNPGRAMSDP
jgi:hypothetical protein